ncbi:hypothetical protein [Roseivirga pacifica]|uniref:hypothetical protein n=1 Tax=Roseivirga pacifica TaxID=1267423 RepID=UPI003BACB200
MRALAIVLLLLMGNLSPAQSYYDIANEKMGNISFTQVELIGMWTVVKVMVGNRELTPTAKWFKYESTGKITGGNGNIQNLNGAYTFDRENKTLVQSNENEVDSYGAFNVSFSDDGKYMAWQRMEDGMEVNVLLERTSEKPKAPWDLIVGGWTMSKAELLNPETKQVQKTLDLERDRYFFMWDRAYRKFNAAGEQVETGVWHIGGHSNEVWTINNADNTKTIWQVEFSKNENHMTWTKEDENGLLKVYFEKVANND